MKRALMIVVSVCAVVVAGYFIASKWAIHHTTLVFYDLLRSDRTVAVDIAVRRDREWQAMADMITLPVAILNHDEPMVTKVGEEYVGRRMQYNRGIANIMFAIDELKKVQPNADYKHLTMIGHSNGGDISMYFAKRHPDMIKKVVTLDNLRVPFVTDGKFKILSFRSEDPVFKTDPGVVPDDDICAKAGITVVKTGYQHTDMSDRGPDEVKSKIASILDETDNEVTPAAARDAPKRAGEPSALALSAASARN
jgi:hypothetical protein